MVEKRLEEQKKAGRRKYFKKKHEDKVKRGSQNHYKELEDKEDNKVLNENSDFEQLYYKHMKENKISHNYIYYQLEKSKAVEEKYKVETMIMQVLESIID